MLKALTPNDYITSVIKALEFYFGCPSENILPEVLMRQVRYVTGEPLFCAIFRTWICDTIDYDDIVDRMNSQLVCEYARYFLKLLVSPADLAKPWTASSASIGDLLGFTSRESITLDDLLTMVPKSDEVMPGNVHLEQVSYGMAHSARFRTKSGYIGRATRILQPQRDIKEGDLVCVLEGCSKPAILSRVGEDYELMSDCFVPGFMYGEAYKPVKGDKLKVTKLTIR
jgi:hypothetical protein